MPALIFNISGELSALGGSVYIVGGWPRDMILKLTSPDLDFEVYGVGYETLLSILKKYGKANLVGKSFGIVNLMFDGRSYDFALPRTESKTGAGHRDFNVIPDPGLSFEQASLRRDFTLNSMGVKLPDMSLIDPNGGYEDLMQRVLRHVSPAFSDDPLRVFRAVQFAARFEYSIAPETVELCRSIDLSSLSKERIFGEFIKLLLKANRPSIGFYLMRELNILPYFQELSSLLNLPQDPEWHPEGDVWIHTIRTVDAMADMRSGDDREDLILMLAALCHDFGKASTTSFMDGRFRSPRHEDEGVRLTESFLNRITDDREIIDSVCALVRDHLKPWQLYTERSKVTQSAIRRLTLRVDVKRLIKLVEADFKGKTIGSCDQAAFEVGTWLLEQCRELEVLDSKPKPYLTGKALLGLGMAPGPEMGKMIRESFELQLDGSISSESEAIGWAKKKLALF